MQIVTILAALVSSVACITTPPSGALVVNQSPKSGQYATIQAAVNALSLTSKAAQTIFIQPGTYKEQVYIRKLAGPLTVYGYSANSQSYSANQVTITADESQMTKPSNDLTATLRVHTPHFKLYNVNVANTYGKGSQAVALSAYAGNQGYYAVKLTGYQDTVLAQSGTQFYAKSYIEGATDFIFGPKAQAWFEKCDIGVVAAPKGYITASGRSSADNGYYVINNSNVAAAPGNNVPVGAYYLGRPWGSYARVTFQNTAMTSVVNAAGWAIWNADNAQIDNVEFSEYENTGAGSMGTRASFSSQLDAPISISTVLGGNYASWVDASFM